MVPNAATTQKMERWVRGHLRGQEFHDMSSSLACIAVQGPKAKEVMAEITSADLLELENFWGGFFNLDRITANRSEPATALLRSRGGLEGPGVKAFVSRTGYTGEDGYEVVCENSDAVAVWRAVMDKGRSFGLKPIGLGARDTLRLEKALLLSGTDFDGTQTSVQTGPGWVIDWSHDFIGKQAMVQQKAEGEYDVLVCMTLEDRGIPRHGYEITREGARIGGVTSGTMSPVLKKGIAMGYVPRDLAAVGTPVTIKIRETEALATIVKPPFVRRG
jgi:aminomethyltransferase